jgi:hypothetical protein
MSYNNIKTANPLLALLAGGTTGVPGGLLGGGALQADENSLWAGNSSPAASVEDKWEATLHKNDPVLNWSRLPTKSEHEKTLIDKIKSLVGENQSTLPPPPDTTSMFSPNQSSVGGGLFAPKTPTFNTLLGMAEDESKADQDKGFFNFIPKMKTVEIDGMPQMHAVSPAEAAELENDFGQIHDLSDPRLQMKVIEQDGVPVKEDTSWWDNLTGHVTGIDRSKGNWIADAGMVAGGLLANKYAPGAGGKLFGKAVALSGGGLGGLRASRYLYDKGEEYERAGSGRDNIPQMKALSPAEAAALGAGRTARTEAVASKDDPTNWANWIKENPGKATIGAGLGSALLYNAAGGREGIQQKAEAMINNPLATVGGLGSLGLLSKITYDAMNKQAEDTSVLDTWVFKPLQGVVQGTPTIQANNVIKETSLNEGNVLSGTDNVIDGVGEYLPAVLGIGALGAAGYGGYRLYDHLREKKSSWYNPTTWFDYPTGGSYGRDYDNVQSRPGEVSLGRKAGLAALTGLGVAPLFAGAVGGTMGGLELFRGGLGSQGWKNFAQTGSKYFKGSLLPGLAAGAVAGIIGMNHLGNRRGKMGPPSREDINKRIGFFNELDARKSPVHRGISRGAFRLLGGGFDKENAHTPTHESKFTGEYNHNSLLDGKQKTELPDFLQKHIIDHRAKTSRPNIVQRKDAFGTRREYNLDSAEGLSDYTAAREKDDRLATWTSAASLGGPIAMYGGLQGLIHGGGGKGALIGGALGLLGGGGAGYLLGKGVTSLGNKFDDYYQGIDRSKLEKRSEASVDAMRRYELANLDAGPSAARNVAAGGLVSLLGGGLAAATGPGGLKSRLLRGTLGALPGVALGTMLENNRQKQYDTLWNLDDSALKNRYTNNKKVMDSLGLDPFTMSNK